MDKFAVSTGLAGLGIGLSALAVLGWLIYLLAKKRAGGGRVLSLAVNALVLFLLSATLIFMSLFVQTLNRYLHDQRIGTITARAADGLIWIDYHDLEKGIHHQFSLEGDQWMAEAYLVRWSPLLRWMGAGAYYKIDRFEGRCEADSSRPVSVHAIDPSHRNLWRQLLKHGGKIPLVDAAYGVAVFQYPSKQRFGLYLGDSGLILKQE